MTAPLVDPFGLPAGHYGAILADPATSFQTWSDVGKGRSASQHYPTMRWQDIMALPVRDLAAKDCVLFMWSTWPTIAQTMMIIGGWGFTYKTCAFCWTKADATQVHMFQDDIEPYMGLGYWTRANTEPCLLATRGKPKRLNADVRQAIIEPRREHSRKPSVHGRIERLVAGPYVELFARARRPGWDAWGNEVDKFREAAE
jgi:N6-adenosine-specific RNA methylase IME4